MEESEPKASRAFSLWVRGSSLPVGRIDDRNGDGRAPMIRNPSVSPADCTVPPTAPSEESVFSTSPRTQRVGTGWFS